MLLVKLKAFLRQLLLIRTIRHAVAWTRYIYFSKICGRLETYQLHARDVSKNTIMHNLKGLKDLGVYRAPILIRPLSVIETLNPDSEILSIGPRTEGELLYLIAHGFNPKRIRGLDLISYSPWIDLGDMHAMPYPDNSFDAVVIGWVLAYSDNKIKAAEEIIRVARQGAIIAVGVEYHPLSPEEIAQELGYSCGSEQRLMNCSEILQLFKNHVDHVYFLHDIVPELKKQQGSICTLFSVVK